MFSELYDKSVTILMNRPSLIRMTFWVAERRARCRKGGDQSVEHIGIEY